MLLKLSLLAVACASLAFSAPPAPSTPSAATSTSIFESAPRLSQMGARVELPAPDAVRTAAECTSWKNVAGGKMVCFKASDSVGAAVASTSKSTWEIQVGSRVVSADPARQLLPNGGSGIVVVPGGTAADPKLGVKKSHSFMFKDSLGPARWNRCTPVGWVADFSQLQGTSLSKDQELLRLQDVFSLISRYSGVKFTYLGEGVVRNGTGKDVFDLDAKTEKLNPHLVLTFGRGQGKGPYVFDEIAGSTAGVGGVYVEKYPGKPMRITEGFVILDVDSAETMVGAANNWRTPSDYVGSIYVHEVLHAMNLGHVNDDSQTMNPVVTHGLARLAAGDRQALAVTRTSPCLK